MFRVLDADSPISKEDFLQFEEILGKKLPEAMKDFYLKYNGGQPQVMGRLNREPPPCGPNGRPTPHTWCTTATSEPSARKPRRWTVLSTRP